MNSYTQGFNRYSAAGLKCFSFKPSKLLHICDVSHPIILVPASPIRPPSSWLCVPRRSWGSSRSAPRNSPDSSLIDSSASSPHGGDPGASTAGSGVASRERILCRRSDMAATDGRGTWWVAWCAWRGGDIVMCWFICLMVHMLYTWDKQIL